jgi:hypothetical protein
MSGGDTDRDKLVKLADAIVDDILATSDAEIIAEVDATYVSQAEAILVEAKMAVSRKLLTRAKSDLAAWQSEQGSRVRTFDRKAVEDRFDKIRSADPALDKKMMMAARNGEPLTDNDKNGLMEDLADLERLEQRDKLE